MQNPNCRSTMYKNTITLEELKQLPDLSFDIPIRMVEGAEALKHMVADLEHTEFLGFDTETQPAFKKGVHHKTALVQFSTAETVYLVRVDKMGVSPYLTELFENSSIKKIGAGLEDDLRGLHEYRKFKPKSFVDLQHIVSQYGIFDRSVVKMAGIILGVKISKKQQLSNWGKSIYTEQQKQYAAIDAWVCREMYIKLQSANYSIGRS